MTVDAYGPYLFYYIGCGDKSEPIILQSKGTKPEILSPINNSNIYCDLEVELEAYVLGDPGYWDFEGPGNAIFDNANDTKTSVSVDKYGTYRFRYYGCGEVNSIKVNFEEIEPVIIVNKDIYCELNTNLNSQIGENQNLVWFINNSPANSNATITNPTSENTNLTVSDYGLYEIGLSSCDNTVFTEINFQRKAPHIIAPNFQSCIQTATLVAYTDDPNGGGPWKQTSGEPGAIFSNPTENVTEVTVPAFGAYSFSYSSCDTTSSVSIGFECPIAIPNTITPNGDGNNDRFVIQNLNPQIYSESILTVYNRWGKIVYLSTKYGFNGNWWDGKTTYQNESISDGIFFYTLELFNRMIQTKEEYTGELHIFISNSSSSNDE